MMVNTLGSGHRDYNLHFTVSQATYKKLTLLRKPTR